MLPEIAQLNPVTLCQPPAVPLALVAETYNLVPASPGTVAPSAAYRPTSKFAASVPAVESHQPISVIVVALAGLVCFVTAA